MVYIFASFMLCWTDFIQRDNTFREREREREPSLIPALKNISHFREHTCPRVWMPREPRIPGGDARTKSALHQRCTSPLQPRIATPYNFVTARSAFRIPLSFHAAGSDVYATRRHDTPLRRFRREEIKFAALDSGVSRYNLQIHDVNAEIRTWVSISIPIYVSTLTCGISMTLNSTTAL